MKTSWWECRDDAKVHAVNGVMVESMLEDSRLNMAMRLRSSYVTMAKLLLLLLRIQ